VRICAVACDMDRHDLLLASMTHLVLNGISDFYIYDHGSEPALAGVLSRTFHDGGVRITVLRKETPPFFHSTMIGVLTELARLDGFETVLAFDADEFWCSTVPDRTLAEQISAEMVAGLASLRVQVLNYVQHRDVLAFTAGSLKTCAYTVVPHVDTTRSCREQVDAGMPFVAMPFPSKVIARLSSDIRFTEGQHGIIAPEGVGTEGEASGIVLRHLSLSAKDELACKREHGLRRIEAGFAPDTGWQLQRLAYMTDEELDAYWANNSWHRSDDGGALVGSYDRLAEDGALVEIGRLLGATIDRQGASATTGANTAPAVHEVEPERLERLLEGLVDDLGTAGRVLSDHQNQILALQAEGAALRLALQERTASLGRLQDALEHLADANAGLDAALKAVEQSASWRLTAPLRAVKRPLRPGK
jgi:hypothetical protein